MKGRNCLYLGAVLAALLWGGAARAATIAVNTLTDENDAVPNSTCSLREAIRSANGDADVGGCTHSGAYGTDTIDLPSGTYTLSIASTCDVDSTGATGDLDISSSLTITGTGGVATIDGGAIDRVFDIFAGAFTVNLSNLIVRNGRPVIGTSICTPGGDGGGIRNNSGATVNLTNVAVTANTTQPGSGIGGGISNRGNLNLIDSTIGPNNVSSSDGGGLYNGCSGAATITNSTISGNTAENNSDGGGIYTDCNQVTIINSTISGNDAVGTDNAGDGGGIYIGFDGQVDLRNVTVTNNTADSNGDGDGDGGGVWAEDAATLIVRNSIIAGNHDGTTSPTLFPDCFTPGSAIITSEDFNLIGDETGCDGFFTGANDQVGTSGSPVNPRLGALANNGGPTQTHALLTTPAASPAIDAANPAGCFSNDANNGTLLTTDQRGSLRPFDGGAVGPTPARCDIGAFELGGCGDGVVDKGEGCDDGNKVDGDGCSAACVLESCGDGTVQTSEACDDGNTADGDGCSSACLLESCGDGIVQAPEVCDDGNSLSTDACLNTCKTASCGDGFVQAGVEGCDDGNLKDGDGCSAACAVESASVFLLGDGGCSLIPEGVQRSVR